MRAFPSLIALCMPLAFSVPSNAETKSVEPLVSKEKIEELARRCGADVKVSLVPGYDEDTGEVKENGTLIVGVQRSNAPNAIQCMTDNVPTVVTALIGRAPGIPPLDEATLKSVLKECDWRIQDGTFALGSDEELQFQPSADAEYERVDCVMTALRPYSPRIGFVGNELFVREEAE